MSKRHPIQHVRSKMLRGLLVVLPLLITVWLLRILFDLVNENITPLVVTLFRALGSPNLDRWQARVGFPIIGLLLTVLTIYLLGVLSGNLTGRRTLGFLESYILRVPVVRGIYGSARQLLDAITMTGSRTFSKVVMFEYPRRGLWTLGFVTNDAKHQIPDRIGGTTAPTVPVFIPTTPNPTSGWLMLVPTDDLLVVEMTIDAAVKLIVSGGIVSPGDLGTRVRPWRGLDRELSETG